MALEKDGRIEGIVTSRRCPHCGHHEIGYTTGEGDFHPLEAGTPIVVMEGPGRPDDASGHESPSASGGEEPRLERDDLEIWVPAPLRGHNPLCLKYGIMVERGTGDEMISKRVYGTGYFEKLKRLIEKEVHTPLAVILDRLFTAPYLATGDSKEIAEAMLREIEEVRAPALLMGAWIEHRDEDRLRQLIRPYGLKDLEGEGISDEELIAALEELSLEDFLEMM